MLRYYHEVMGKSANNSLETYAGVYSRPENRNAIRVWNRFADGLDKLATPWAAPAVKDVLRNCFDNAGPLQAAKKVPASQTEFWDFVLAGLLLKPIPLEQSDLLSR